MGAIPNILSVVTFLPLVGAGLILLAKLMAKSNEGGIARWVALATTLVTLAVSTVLVLGIVQGAYSAEIIRGAIQAIPVGQLEAARAFGIERWLLVRRVLLPSMLPFAMAGLSNLWLVLVKDSALISIVGYSELLSVGKQAAGSTKHYLVFYLAVAAVYNLQP